jgi:hypothetical protein
MQRRLDAVPRSIGRDGEGLPCQRGSSLWNVAHSEAESYIKGLGKLSSLALSAHEAMAELGCSSYVKTIYVGYDLGGEMVAAMYGHSTHLEIALALPEDAESQLLVDASHLTWRTLPVAAIVRDKTHLDEFARLADQACGRVRTSSHDVRRENDFFIKARESRRPQR